MVLDIYTTSVTSEHLGENDAVNGCKLAESMLLNLRGHLDEVRLMPALRRSLLTFCRIAPTTHHRDLLQAHGHSRDFCSAPRQPRGTH